MGGIVFENARYDVRINDTSDGYLIVNKETLVQEATAEDLPSAKLVASQFDFLLENDIHMQIRKEMMDQMGVSGPSSLDYNVSPLN